jgi:MFS family permease
VLSGACGVLGKVGRRLSSNFGHNRGVAREHSKNNETQFEGVESAYAWTRLWTALLLSTIGGVGMWSVVVALPAVQAEFGVARGDASLPYTFTMIGFGLGGIVLGKLSDRFGVVLPLCIGASCLALGYAAAAAAPTLFWYSAAQGVLVGVGSSATFAPLLADTSLWFTRRRGIAVGIFASGNYLAGTVWPIVIQHFIETAGWRNTFYGIAVFCAFTMFPLALALRRRAPESAMGAVAGGPRAPAGRSPPGMSARTLQVLLAIASICCCVAMSMPQVHLVAYCGDLGYGAARGAQMLSLMLACGIVSRIGFGWISDRLGGLRTLLLGSALQGIALLLFLPFNGLVSLYLISALFGLFQGGIVPAYAIIIREYFSPREAGARVGIVITASLFGMALGGWMSGAIFDVTGSYKAAFLNGIGWNLVNLLIASMLLIRLGAGGRARAAAV